MEKNSQGPIRWGAVAPFTIIVVFTYIYFHFFFDHNLRRGGEWVGTKAMGAEVNIAELNTSFWSASLEIRNIEMTDPEKPTHNLIQFGDIRFGMLWDALLRGKVVINEAAVEQISVSSPRQSPGWVKPPEPPPPPSTGPSELEKQGKELAKNTLDAVAEGDEDNILGDLGALLGGAKGEDQTKALEGQLKSKVKIAALQKQLDEKKVVWDQKLKSLPQGKEIQALADKFKAVKTSNFKTPQEFQDTLSKIQELTKQADALLKTVQSTGSEINADLKNFESDLKSVQALVNEDFNTLKAHFKIPTLDANKISHALLKKYAGPYLAKFEKYHNLIRKYLPEKKAGDVKKSEKDSEDISMQPRARARGVSYEFGRTNSYPSFWLKKSVISSKAVAGQPYMGNLKGELTNLTSNQVLLGKPTQLVIKGDFPELQIDGLDIAATMNHTHQPYVESLVAKIGSYPLVDKTVVDSKDLILGFKKATGNALMTADYSNKSLKFNIENHYQKLDYQVSSPNKDLEPLIKNIFAGIPQIDILIRGEGELPNVPLFIKSNLGEEISKGFQKQLQAKIDEARAKIQKMLDESIGKEKAKLESQFNTAKAQVDNEVKKAQDQIQAKKTEANAKVEQAQKQQKQGVENQLKKAIGPDADRKLEELKKKFKF